MSKKVLLIEDFPVIQKLYGEFMQGHGFDVDIAYDGHVALEKVKDNTYDFVLVDLLLPQVNGIEFLEKFTNRPAQTKVIVLSDFNEPHTYERAHQLGIEAYLIKAENTPSELVAKLHKMDEPKDEPKES